VTGSSVFNEYSFLCLPYLTENSRYKSIILELKAVKDIAPEHKAQLFNYLKATKLRMGLLINFGFYPKAQIIRIVI
jgi:GxxExxY protein